MPWFVCFEIIVTSDGGTPINKLSGLSAPSTLSRDDAIDEVYNALSAKGRTVLRLHDVYQYQENCDDQ